MTKTPPLQRFRNWCRRTNHTDSSSGDEKVKPEKKHSSSKLKQTSACSEGTTLSIKARSGGDVLKRGTSFKVGSVCAGASPQLRRARRLSSACLHSGRAE